MYTPAKAVILIRTNSFTHPLVIFHVDVSSLISKDPHCVDIAQPSCLMQGSSLAGKRNNV